MVKNVDVYVDIFKTHICNIRLIYRGLGAILSLE